MQRSQDRMYEWIPFVFELTRLHFMLLNFLADGFHSLRISVKRLILSSLKPFLRLCQYYRKLHQYNYLDFVSLVEVL